MKTKSKNVFLLNHQSLEAIFQGLHILPNHLAKPKDPRQGLILFAFRGCLPTRAMQGWGKSITLKTAVLDHIHMRCTLGIWDPIQKRIFAARGSTVPNRTQVEIAAARKGKLKGKGTNQLEPGFYQDLTKGEHLQGKRNGHQALRQTAGRFYRRSPSGLPFTEASPLYFGNPYDNLHCGWNLDGLAAGFSSAGCLVVAGLPHCPRHETNEPDQGPWKIFHDILYDRDQKTFSILLIPFEKIQKVLKGKPKVIRASKKYIAPKRLDPNLVYGSMGEPVKSLQRALASQGRYRGRINGILDTRTYRAWKRVSNEKHGATKQPPTKVGGLKITD
jgi:hypothetical protein